MIDGGLGNLTDDLGSLPVFDTGLNVTVDLSADAGVDGTVYLGSSLADLGDLGIDDIIRTVGTGVMIDGGLGNITGLDLPVFADGLYVTLGLSAADLTFSSEESNGTVYLGDLGQLNIQDLGIDNLILPNFGDLNHDGSISEVEDFALDVQLNIESDDLPSLGFITENNPECLREFFTNLGHSGIDVVNFMDQGAFDSFANILQGNDSVESFESAVNSSGQDFRSVEVKIIGVNEDPFNIDGNLRT